MNLPSATHVVLIPTYNTGDNVFATVRAARAVWNPVWVVVDGSTDGTADALRRMEATDAGLHVLVLARNHGKGAAILHGLHMARQGGFTHVLTMDADGQHPAGSIVHFMAASAAAPDAMILCQPMFDDSAPRARLYGRKISNWLARIETLGADIADCLCGFRVYPIAPLLASMESTGWMRRFDFDPEAAVRLCRAGVRPINVPAPIRYFSAAEGGVSHFNYIRDNILLTWMHARLVSRLPILIARNRARG